MLGSYAYDTSSQRLALRARARRRGVEAIRALRQESDALVEAARLRQSWQERAPTPSWRRWLAYKRHELRYWLRGDTRTGKQKFADRCRILFELQPEAVFV
jgi:hypothetical protein